ncbi:MAG: glycerol-3-phosphate dehydrogenase [Crocinitomicaceae bacterium]|nr:glycerol-3-phosphate dehydrogenase [Crocinitomicaceae bacterium]|tara:strand:+ start:35583 stop:36581 length:999 start_codon:yes stop_codon:yes gene_type:complete
MSASLKIGLLGSGSWATALAKMICENTNKLNWWIRSEEMLEYLGKFGHNPRYIESIEFQTSQLALSNNMQEVIDNSDVVIIAIPSMFLHDAFEEHNPQGLKNKLVFSAIKGMIPQYNSIPARYLHKSLNIPYDNIGIICGPCHAEEVARERLSYLTVACPKTENAENFSSFLSTRYIRVKTSDDVFGVELAAVLKNVYAVGAGIAHGLGYGDNFISVLISNAAIEMKRFIDIVHDIDRNIKSSTYLGDLLVTAYSVNSRNRALGTMVGTGYTVKTAVIEMKMVAEGMTGAKGINEMNKKFKVDIPIADAVYRILHERMSPVLEMRLLSDNLS